MKATGTPAEFARKLGVRRSTMFQSLQDMREMGVKIRYSYLRRSYFYPDGRRIKIRIEGFEDSDVFPQKLKALNEI